MRTEEMFSLKEDTLKGLSSTKTKFKTIKTKTY